MEPEYPYDFEELKQIERLLDKIPLYREKISELTKEIENFSCNAVEYCNIGRTTYEIEHLILKAFYIDCENRPFNSKESKNIASLLAEIAWHGEIKNRNIPCEICGENRSIDRCHIIPKKFGGTMDSNNILYLCPTHHRLFDRFLLTKAEWGLIDWERKSIPSQQYAKSIIFEAHKKFWKKIEDGDEPEKLKSYEINTVEFVKYVIRLLSELFIKGRPIKKSSIYGLIDPNIKEVSKEIINYLVKHGFIEQIKDKSSYFLILGAERLDIPDSVALSIWQKIA